MFKKLSAAALVAGLGVTSAQASLLYKITGDDLAEPSYLFGTIHLICQSDFKIHAPTQAALESAERVIMELDMDDPGMAMNMQANMQQPDGAKMSSHLDQDQVALLDDFLVNNMGANLAMVDTLRPFVISGMVMATQMECATPVSYENYFTQQAQALSVPVEGLETVAFQFSVFDQIPHKKQVQWLIESLEKPQESKAEVARMLSHYQAQDMEALYDMFSEQDAYAEYQTLMLDDRNRNWQQALQVELPKDGSEFIAVGAGHLGGKAGIISLLRESGYTVEAVAMDADD